MTQTKQISWKTKPEEFEPLNNIADRAVLLAESIGIDYPKRTALMDITATHANGCRLDLARLLAAGDGDFAHDVLGIRRHLNRDTGELEGFFVPRLAERY